MRSRILLLSVPALIALTPVLTAMWAMPYAVPLERILPQLEARVAKDPKDAHGQYLLGRAHGAAFARGAASVMIFPSRDPVATLQRKDGRSPLATTRGQQSKELSEKRLPPEEACLHLCAALRHLSLAVELAPQDALYHLGFANALDSGSHLAAMVDSTEIAPTTFLPLTQEERAALLDDLSSASEPGPVATAAEERLLRLHARAVPYLNQRRADPNVTRQSIAARLLTLGWRELAIEHYERAFTLAFEVESRLERANFERLLDLTSYEAATSYARLVHARGVRDEMEAARLSIVREGIAKLEQIPPPDWVTPILIPDRSDTSLAQLFDGAVANFDLAGIGEAQAWHWPNAEASFLVWDPECEGTIRSGRQLFGSSTWWMFFEDGYRALEALDADGDGWLRGAELEGLALWRDRDRNGVCDGGEVETTPQRGITAICTRASGIDPDDCLSPTCARGVLFEDGSTRASFDWVAAPASPRP